MSSLENVISPKEGGIIESLMDYSLPAQAKKSFN